MVGGSYYYAEEREKRKVFENAVAQKKAIEKKEAWIRELEARDEEDRQLRAKKELERKKKLDSVKTLASSVIEQTEERRLSVLDAVRELPGFRR